MERTERVDGDGEDDDEGERRRRRRRRPRRRTAPDPTWVVCRGRARGAGLDEARGPWRVSGQELKVTNLDKVLFPPRDGVDEPALTKRDLIAYFARIAPAMLPHLVDRPLNLQRFPNGAGAPGLLAEGHPVDRRPSGSRSGTRPDSASARTGRRTTTSSPTARRPCAGSATRRRSRSMRGPRRTEEPWTPTFALIDIDPGTKTTWDETLVARAASTGRPSSTSASAPIPKLTGSRGIQAWIPIERGRYDVQRHARMGREAVAGDRRRPCPTSCRGSGRRPIGAARRASTTPRTRRSRRSWRRTRSGPRPGAPVSAPIRWEELDDPTLRPDRWTITTLPGARRGSRRPVGGPPGGPPGPAAALTRQAPRGVVEG